MDTQQSPPSSNWKDQYHIPEKSFPSQASSVHIGSSPKPSEPPQFSEPAELSDLFDLSETLELSKQPKPIPINFALYTKTSYERKEIDTE